jgi:outer membrane biosynthesis protein TonB
MTARTAVLAALGGCALAAGCSTGTIHVASTQDVLQSDVLAVTQASSTHNWPAARAAVTDLRSDLADAIASGRVGAARADAIRRHLASVAADIAAQHAAPAAPTSKTTTPPPPTKATTTPAPQTQTKPKPIPQPKPKPKPKPPKHDKHGHGGGKAGDDNGD